MPFVTADGKRLEYFEQGSGNELVILVHGSGSSALIWDSMQTRLAMNGFRSIAISLPGAGGSDRPTDLAEYNPEAYARTIREALASLGMTRFAIVGHSLGVANVLNFAADYAAGFVIEALILMAGGNPGERPAPSAARTDEIRRAWQPPNPASSAQRRAEWEELHLGLPVAVRDQLWRDIENNPMEREVGQRLGARKDLSSFTSTTEIPTLIISGDADSVVPLNYSLDLYLAFHEGVRHCHVLHGIDHYPNAEAPDLVADVCTRFLRHVTRTPYTPGDLRG